MPLILCDEEDGRPARLHWQEARPGSLPHLVRGLSEAQIKQLAVEAMFAPLVDKLPDEKLRQQVRYIWEGVSQLTKQRFHRGAVSAA